MTAIMGSDHNAVRSLLLGAQIVGLKHVIEAAGDSLLLTVAKNGVTTKVAIVAERGADIPLALDLRLMR